MIFNRHKSNIIVNGKSYSGNNIIVNNNSVIIDGEIQESGLSGIVSIKVEGDLASLSCNAPTTVNGNVKGDVKVNGSLKCGNVSGNVKANGSISMGRQL